MPKPARMLLTYHKGLSRFFRRVFPTPMHASSKQDMAIIRDALREGNTRYVLSIHNPRFDPNNPVFADARIIHIIRHPKDLIVSGYYYHKSGAEEWTSWKVELHFVQNVVTNLLEHLNEDDINYFKTCPSYHDMLNHLNFEVGMMLEIVWRKYRQRFFPLLYYQHPNVATFRFEEIMSDTLGAVKDICKVYEMDKEETQAALQRAEYETADPGPHVRNKAAYQYLDEFTPAITEFYNRQYPQLAEHLGYPP